MPARPAIALLLLSAVAVHAQAVPPGPRQLVAVAAARPCADLAAVDIAAVGGEGSRMLSAVKSDRGGIGTCVVEGTMTPSIRFTVLLPTDTWTGRYLQVGCGGLCGRVSLEVGAADGCAPVARGGFVVASTDMGHAGMGGEFGTDPQKRADFAHRAMHLTAVVAKQLAREYYGTGPRYSYFTGCSDGGREALVEAQRYPHDFDGIIAGAPAMGFQVQNGLFHAWQAVSNTGREGRPVLLAPRLAVLHRRILEQCDLLDGQADGLLTDPRACRVDPRSLVCDAATPEGGPNCLSAGEAEVARRFYDGPRDPATGERLTLGGPQPGSELAWAGVFVPSSPSQPMFSERIALDALRNLVFPTNPPPAFGLSDVSFDRSWIERLRPLHALYDATNPDLSAFARAGGKLMLWHGWSDPHISPINTIAYHEAVGAQLGASARDGFSRLYLLPGVHHCGGGEGPSRIDLLTPMMAWVEQGVAPDAILAHAAAPGPSSGFGLPAPPPDGGARPPALAAAATRADGESRPVYPYPFVAKWDGTGDPARGSSYVRGPASAYPVPAWAGADFFKPYAPLER